MYAYHNLVTAVPKLTLHLSFVFLVSFSLSKYANDIFYKPYHIQCSALAGSNILILIKTEKQDFNENDKL